MELLFSSLYCSFFNLNAGTPPKPKALKHKEVGRDSVMLQWEPPIHDGGAPVTNYVIEKRDMRRDRWTYVHKVTPLYFILGNNPTLSILLGKLSSFP